MRIDEGTTQGGFVPQEPNREPADNSKKLMLFCFFLAVLVAVAGFSVQQSMSRVQSAIAAQETEIVSLEEELEGYRDAKEAKTDGEKGDIKTSENEETSRAVTDDAAAKDFLKMLLTWDSYQNYVDIRSRLASEYGLPADGQLLTSFMPDVPEEALGDSNMRFTEMHSYEMDTNGDTVSYFALCKVQNRIDGNVGNGKVAVFYSVHKDGTLTDVSAYALAR